MTDRQIQIEMLAIATYESQARAHSDRTGMSWPSWGLVDVKTREAYRKGAREMAGDE